MKKRMMIIRIIRILHKGKGSYYAPMAPTLDLGFIDMIERPGSGTVSRSFDWKSFRLKLRMKFKLPGLVFRV